MGRKLKLTDELREAITKSIRAGIDIGSACAREGIHKTTLYEWIKRAESGEEPFVSFAEAVEQAQAEIARRVTFNVVRASETDWRAGAWWLERRMGSVYAPPRQHITTETAIAKEVDAMTETQLLAVARSVLVARGALPSSVSVTDDDDDENE